MGEIDLYRFESELRRSGLPEIQIYTALLIISRDKSVLLNRFLKKEIPINLTSAYPFLSDAFKKKIDFLWAKGEISHAENGFMPHQNYWPHFIHKHIFPQLEPDKAYIGDPADRDGSTMVRYIDSFVAIHTSSMIGLIPRLGGEIHLDHYTVTLNDAFAPSISTLQIQHESGTNSLEVRLSQDSNIAIIKRGNIKGKNILSPYKNGHRVPALRILKRMKRYCIEDTSKP